MLYSMNRDKQLKAEKALLMYKESIRKSFDLYLFNLLHFIRIAEYAKKDADRKHSKLLPSAEDKLFVAKLGDNLLIRSILEEEGFQRLIKARNLNDRIDPDNSRLIYMEFAKTKEYIEYLKQPDSQLADHKNILLSLFKHCSSSESFSELIDDNFVNWIDDKSLIIGAMKKTIKALPATIEFYESYRPPSETTQEFGEVLLMQVTTLDKDLLAIIEPTLKNWDVDRVAVIDMILLKMALCELTNFPTIPTKVTLNEFVEISKIYSTEKSKDFINGILDRLMKKLESEGRINKKGRGLVE